MLKAQASRIFASCLKFDINRINADEFRTYVRYMYNLPQLLKLQSPKPMSDLGYECDTCLREGHDLLPLNATADHAIACPSTYVARYATHNAIRNTIARYGNRMGSLASTEPPTERLLKGAFTKKICDIMLPQNCSGPQRVAQNDFWAICDTYRQNGDPGWNASVTKALDDLATTTPTVEDGRRIDVEIEAPSGHSFWIDCAGAQAHHSWRRHVQDKEVGTGRRRPWHPGTLLWGAGHHH